MTPISIIVPAHNESHYLPELIKSLQQFLHLNYEVIVVDNGSTDDTQTIARELKVKLIVLDKKCYPSTARNAGVAQAQADTLIFLDADIVITQEWADEIQHLCNNNTWPGKEFLIGDTYRTSKNPAWIEKYWFEPMSASKNNYLNGGNIITNKTTMQTLGGFNEQLETGEDVDLSVRAKEAGIPVIFNKKLSVHHEGYPKNIKHFFRRERWHGKGDWLSLYFFSRSKVAQIAALFGFCYLAIVIAISLAVISPESPWPPILLGAALAIMFGASFFSSLLKFKKFGFKTIAAGTFLYFIYFTARLNSALLISGKA